MSGPVAGIYAETLAVFESVGGPTEPLTASEVAAALDCGRRTAHKRLQRLADRGALETKRVGASARVWWPAPPTGAADDTDTETDEQATLRRYRRLIDALGDPVYELDAEGRFVYVNDAAVRLSGYSRTELLGESATIGMDDDTVTRIGAIMADLLATDTADAFTIQYEAIRRDGSRVPVENHIALIQDADGRLVGSTGVVRDISERRRRERDLERSQSLLHSAERLGSVGAWEYDAADDRLHWTAGLRQLLGVDGRVTPTLERALGFFAEPDRDPLRAQFSDCLTDGEPFSMTVQLETATGASRWMQLSGERVSDAADTARVRGHLQDITDHVDRERALKRQQTALATLNTLHGAVREVTAAVVEQSSREEIEAVAVEHLAAADSYAFAWIAAVDPQTGDVVPRAEAGVTGYLDSIALSSDTAREHGRGPTGRAIETQSIAVCQDVLEDPAFAPWREAAQEYGFRATAAIPICHEGTLYGVLGLYSDRRGAFSAVEQSVLGPLGEVLGHAIAGVERKQALLSDEVVELTLRIPDLFGDTDVTSDRRVRVTCDHTVALDGAFLVFGRTDAESVPVLEALAAAPENAWLTAFERITTLGDAVRFRAHLVDPSVLSVVAAAGGQVDSLTVEGAGATVALQIPAGADPQRVVRALRTRFPAATLLSRHQRARREAPTATATQRLAQTLTERQRQALETAHFMGYFETPRGHSGEAVAASLGLSSSTFHQHLRKAERAVMETLLAP